MTCLAVLGVKLRSTFAGTEEQTPGDVQEHPAFTLHQGYALVDCRSKKLSLCVLLSGT